jgi:hypothetical protein
MMMLHIMLFSFLMNHCHAWSYQSLQRQVNKMALTRRDPIQMPTQTPMVPYKVSQLSVTKQSLMVIYCIYFAIFRFVFDLFVLFLDSFSTFESLLVQTMPNLLI